MTTTRPYDSARYLDTPEAQAEYLTAAFETGDPGFIAEAIGTVMRVLQAMGLRLSATPADKTEAA